MTDFSTAPRVRRWVSEEAVLGELEALADMSMATVADYARASEQRAHAEAEHKRLRARAILQHQAAGRAESTRVSVAQAETMAEADDDVSAAYLQRLVTDASADSLKQALLSIRTNQEALRTAAASARDGVVGPGMSGRR